MAAVAPLEDDADLHRFASLQPASFAGFRGINGLFFVSFHSAALADFQANHRL